MNKLRMECLGIGPKYGTRTVVVVGKVMTKISIQHLVDAIIKAKDPVKAEKKEIFEHLIKKEGGQMTELKPECETCREDLGNIKEEWSWALSETRKAELMSNILRHIEECNQCRQYFYGSWLAKQSRLAKKENAITATA